MGAFDSEGGEDVKADLGQGAPPTLDRALRDARPEADAGLARRLAMRGVLGAIGRPAPEPTVGPWVLERQVGAGGMGVVYRARDGRTGQRVALKLLAAERRDAARFEREARVLRSIGHPAVVRYIDHGTTEAGQRWLVMEWLEGRDLAEVLRQGPLAVEAVLRLGLVAAQGLGAAHRAGVIHRDVKPANLFLVGEGLGDPRVVDFGIARSTDEAATRLTMTGAMLGTPSYMAPEQLRGLAEPRTDVYGLGATLFECLAGRPPFEGDGPGAVLAAAVAHEVPSLVQLRADVPAAIDALIGRMLAREPAGRPASMAAVEAEIAQLLTDPGAGVISRAERRPGSAARRPEQDDGGLLGRARELGLVMGIVDGCVEEQRSARVDLVGVPGIGRSAFLGAVASLAQGRTGWTVLRACCDAADLGWPFSLLGQLFSGARSWLEDGGGVDPLVVADRARLRALDRLEQASADGPLLICVDDARYADLSSLRLLHRAVEELADRPVILLVVGEGTAPDAIRLELGPLGERSARRLAARWAPDAAEREREGWVRLSEGHPGHLGELCRSGGAAGTRSAAAALAWARVADVDPETRRVLRACAMVGHEVWPGAVRAMLGVAAGATWLDEGLLRLVHAGLLQPSVRSRLTGEAQLEFVSELLPLALQELCTDEDLQVGHRVMSVWSAKHDVLGPDARGRHLLAIGEVEQAARCFLAAARAALIGGDEESLEAHLEQARSCVTEATRAELCLVTASAAWWRGRMDEAVAAATEGLGAAAVGSPTWFQVLHLAITSAGQAGDNAQVLSLGRACAATLPAGPEAAEARIVGLCRAVTQLDALADSGAAGLWSAVDDLPAGAHGPEARAWLARARVTRSATRSFDEAIGALIEAHRAHVEGGDLRSAALIGLFLGSFHAWSGAWERAREVVEESARTARRLNAAYLITWARHTEGKRLVETDPARAVDHLEQVAEQAASSPRIRSGALVYASLAALRLGDATRALTLARAADHPAVRLAGAAAAVRALLALGRVGEASGLASELGEPLGDGPAIVEFDELVGLARVELRRALGDEAGYGQALTVARSRIEVRADTLADPLQRNLYLAGPHLVVATLALPERLS